MSLVDRPAALALFERQHSVAARPQLLEWMSSSELNALVGRGVLVRVQRGVYRPAGATLGREGLALAAVLRCSEGSRLTGPFTLGLNGFDGFHLGDPFQVLVPPGRRPTNVPFPIREDPDPDTPTVMRGAVPLVTPERALIDSGRRQFKVDAGRLLSAYDSARWQGATTTERFREELAAAGPRDKGAARWRGLDRTGLLVPESAKERTLVEWMSVFEPAPEPQVWVTPRRRVDLFWRILRLALEYQGRRAHGHAEGRAQDVVREAELERVGVVTLPIVAEDMRQRGPFLDWIARLAEARAAELGVPCPVRTD